MRLLHTADWHLGRIFHGVHLTEDQAHVLDELVRLVADARPDAVLVAGDVFDRAVPPQEAVALLDEVLSRIVLGLEVPVVLVAGNHDSPERLAFGAEMLARSRLHVAGRVAAEPRPVVLEDAHGPVEVWPVPFLEPAVVREALGDGEVHDQRAALAAMLDRVRAAATPGRRQVLVAHAAVAGCATSESERPLAIGGAETVEPALFEGFHYVALGHLHRPQAAGAGHVRYAGSLLKYSFSEIDHVKSVTLVELDRAGRCRTEAIPLAPRRDLRRIEGRIAEIEARGPEGPSEDYLLVRLLDEGPVVDPMGRLRRIYPNVLHVERPRWTPQADGAARPDVHRRLSDEDLFAAFFEQMTGEALDAEARETLREVLDALRREEAGRAAEGAP